MNIHSTYIGTWGMMINDILDVPKNGRGLGFFFAAGEAEGDTISSHPLFLVSNHPLMVNLDIGFMIVLATLHASAKHQIER